MKSKEQYYLISEVNGEAVGEEIYTGANKEEIIRKIVETDAMGKSWCADGLRIRNKYEIGGESYRLQLVSEYEAQKADRQKLRSKIGHIEAVIDMADKMKNAYFWDNNMNAKLRESYDRYHSVPEVCWEEGGHTYSAAFSTQSSRHNVYAKGYYYKDDEKTNLRAIRCSYNRMCDAYEKQYRLGKYADLPEKTEEKPVEEKQPAKKKRRSRGM